MNFSSFAIVVVVVLLQAAVDKSAASPNSTSPDVVQNLCLQQTLASQYCFDDGVFNATRCNQSIVTEWLNAFNRDAQNKAYIRRVAAWNFVTNITDATMAATNQAGQVMVGWFVQKLVEALRFPRNTTYYDAKTVAMLDAIATTNSLCDEKDAARLIELSTLLAESFSNMKACFDDTPLKKCLTGPSKFADELSKADDYDTLRKLWERFYNGAADFKTRFIERLKLLNKGAQQNGFRDNGYYEWFTDVGDANFLQKMKKLLAEIDPFYRELHAYVRYKLSRKYPGKVSLKKPIPIHLTRNMYGQTWGNLIGIVKPYSMVPDTDITPELQRKNYTTEKMFRLSEDFFVSIGMFNMTQTFWNKSMFEQPTDGRNVVCHGSAWDFQVDDDYRVLMCTKPTMDQFTTIHHEMGHVEYFMAYRKQPYVFRDDAQSGFHEAVGDTMTLSVLTPEHLKAVGLIGEVPSSKEFDINFLMIMALDKIPFFSFALTMDLWRWGTFNGSIPESRFNAEWWRMRLEMGGLVPPTESDRSSEALFDAGAKYHVTNNVPYIRYFMSFFLQFQFYESLCRQAGHIGPLHRCDFYGSKDAGKKLLQMLELGRSTNWHDQLKGLTGSSEIDSRAILRYFQPLYEWLKKFNDARNVPRGWVNAASPSSGSYGSLTLLNLLITVMVFRYQ